MCLLSDPKIADNQLASGGGELFHLKGWKQREKPQVREVQTSPWPSTDTSSLTRDCLCKVQKNPNASKFIWGKASPGLLEKLQRAAPLQESLLILVTNLTKVTCSSLAELAARSPAVSCCSVPPPSSTIPCSPSRNFERARDTVPKTR